MAKTLEEYLKENPNAKLGAADMALGRQNFGALEGILEARKEWSQATTQEEKDAAHNKAENLRKLYGNYSGGADGMGGQYSPTYVKPSKAAESSNVDALFDRFNNAYKGTAPTWTPQYEEQIQGILAELGDRKPFTYDMNSDQLYQQYRDQYIREGKRAMQDTAAQAAAMTGGYGSTYGAIAAQQGYDNYLAGLNDKVTQLEQIAYGKYADELADMYNRLGAYQTEENRLYSQYLDALGQYNTDRSFAYNAMQAAMGQNNYENEFDRNIFESDRSFGLTQEQWDLQKQQQAIENALATGDYRVLKEMGFDTGYLEFLQQVDRAQGAYTMAKLNGTAGSGTGSGNKSKSSNKNKNNNDNNSNSNNSSNNSKDNKVTNGYTFLVMNFKVLGDTPAFEKKAADMIQKGQVTKADYQKFLKDYGK